MKYRIIEVQKNKYECERQIGWWWFKFWYPMTKVLNEESNNEAMTIQYSFDKVEDAEVFILEDQVKRNKLGRRTVKIIEYEVSNRKL